MDKSHLEELSPIELSQRCALLAELRAIVISILTGRINPVTLTVLALRYADMKGSPVPYRRLGCNSLAQVFHDYFRDEMVCNFMHYYNDYVVWMQHDIITRDTVISRLKQYTAIAGRKHPFSGSHSLRRLSSGPLRLPTYKKLSAKSARLLIGGGACDHDPRSSYEDYDDPDADFTPLPDLPTENGADVTRNGRRSEPKLLNVASTRTQPTAKRRLSTESSLILPVQRMKISDSTGELVTGASPAGQSDACDSEDDRSSCPMDE